MKLIGVIRNYGSIEELYASAEEVQVGEQARVDQR